jgi:dihydropyrimidinase
VSSDDWVSGTRAALLGGTTTIVDYAGQERGGTLAEGVERWQDRAAGRACIDYGFHLMVTDVNPATLAEMPAIVAAGVSSFKLFTAYPGSSYSDDGQILQAMQAAARCDATVMMHAENGIAIDVLRADALARGDTDPIHHLLTRPASLEAEAVHRVARLAEIAGCRLVIVHISSADALAEAVAARDRGLPVYAETCPQYLFLASRTSPTASRRRSTCAHHPCAGAPRGTRTSCGPRSRADASTPSRPTTARSLGAEGGRPRGLHPHPERPRRRRAPPRPPPPGRRRGAAVAGALGRGVLHRAGPARRPAPAQGVIAPGADADLVIYDPTARRRLSAADHHMRLDYSVFEGLEVTGRVDTVLLRGRVVVEGGEHVGAPGDGRFLPRDRRRCEEEQTMTATTPGMVCAHHHLYSALARGMPPPPRTPTDFGEILELIWWRLDAALDLEMIRWSAMLGALEALEQGTTAIIDHHESPNAIEGSLSVIADACAEVGVRVVCAYGVTDRHGPDGARRGLEENRRFLAEGGRGLVGVHAAFTCTDETLLGRRGLAAELGVGVHVHVCEGTQDADCAGPPARARPRRLAARPRRQPAGGPGAGGHDRAQPPVEPQQRRRLRPAGALRKPGRARLRRDRRGDARRVPHRLPVPPRRRRDRLPGGGVGLARGGPRARARDGDDVVTWSYDPIDPWHLAFTPGVRPVRVVVDGEVILDEGGPTRVDPRRSGRRPPSRPGASTPGCEGAHHDELPSVRSRPPPQRDPRESSRGSRRRTRRSAYPAGTVIVTVKVSVKYTSDVVLSRTTAPQLPHTGAASLATCNVASVRNCVLSVKVAAARR